jgi:hypothetical protein
MPYYAKTDRSRPLIAWLYRKLKYSSNNIWIWKWNVTSICTSIFSFLFGAKNRDQKATLIQISGEKSLFFQKRVAKFH